jgi:hypothetical protein
VKVNILPGEEQQFRLAKPSQDRHYEKLAEQTGFFPGREEPYASVVFPSIPHLLDRIPGCLAPGNRHAIEVAQKRQPKRLARILGVSIDY